MKINRINDNIEHVTVQTTLKSISVFDKTKADGAKASIIILRTANGNFTNFESVFKRQNIDVESLPDNAPVKITYVIHTAKNGVQYKNFTSVEVA